MEKRNPFPSLTKRPLPHPGKATSGSTTLSFHPDQPVYWEEKGKEKFALPEDAKVRKMESGTVAPGTVLQGMLFKPETLKEHWDSPERHKAVRGITVESNPNDFSEVVSSVHRNIRESLMPTSLIKELANEGTTVRTHLPEGVWGWNTSGVYTHEDQIAHVNTWRSGSLMHELGHHTHNLMGRNMSGTTHRYGGNRTQRVVGAADPLLEGVAEGFARRYDKDEPSVAYNHPLYPGWHGYEGHELYKHVHDQVKDSGEIPIINRNLLRPLYQNTGGDADEDIEVLNDNTYRKTLGMLKSGNIDIESTPKHHQPTLWDD